LAVEGSLSLLSSGGLQGVVLYQNVFPSVYLGQTSGVSFRNSFFVEQPEKVVTALLEVGIIASSSTIRGLVLSVNGITLTREFKPLTCAPYGEKMFCKAVYDIKPVVESKPATAWTVEIEYRGLHELAVEHLGLLVLRGHESAENRHAYYSGALSLRPGDSYEIRLLGEAAEGELRIVALIPSQEASLVVEAGGSAHRLQGSGFNEYSIPVSSLESVVLRHEGGGSYYPREILVSAVLAYHVKAPEPVIEARLVRMEQGRATVEIANAGGEAAHNIIVVSFSKGNVLERKIIERIEPGQAQRLDLKAEPGGSIRVIWRYLDKTIFRDIKLKR